MRDLNELGLKPRRRNPYAPATDEAFAAFEAAFGLKLPEAYKAFLRHINGGRAALREYPDPRGGIGEVNDFYGLGSQVDDEALETLGKWEIGNLWGEIRVLRPVLGDRAVPFARDGGDNQLVLDVSVDPAPVVRVISATRGRYRLFGSFEEFLQALRVPGPS